MGTGDSKPLEVIVEGLLNSSSSEFNLDFAFVFFVLHSRYINTLNIF